MTSANPPERVQHELRRTYLLRRLAHPRRSILSLHRSRSLDRPCADAGARADRRAIHRRCHWPVRRAWRQRGPGVSLRRAGAGERPAADRPRYGGVHETSRLWRHLFHRLRASVSLRAAETTLDHLTKGRAGWNIVTSYLDSGARNLGQARLLDHDNRYDVADEYLDVCYKLWEGSWEDDAVRRDAAANVFTDPAKVHEIRHEGRYFKVPGAHISEPSPQRTPVLYQAGASSRGRDFAAKHAESAFVAAPSKKLLKEYVTDLRRRAVAAGRRATTSSPSRSSPSFWVKPTRRHGISSISTSSTWTATARWR